MNCKYGFFFFLLLLFAGPLNMGAQNTQPNIIVIFMDDMGYNDIGAQTFPEQDPYPTSGPTPKPGYSDPDIPAPNEAQGLTPAIDRIASEGVRMSRYYTVPLCSPARGSLLSGRYNQRLNITRVFFPGNNLSGGFSTQEVTLPELLREEGYTTGMMGKWHLGYRPDLHSPFQLMPTRHGFEYFYGFPHSNDMSNYDLIENETVLDTRSASEADQTDITWLLTEKALSFINESTAEDAPFFLFFSHPMTHIPCWPSNQTFENADGTIWPQFKGASGVSYYYDIVMEVDHSVDRILDKLDELGIADDTIVVFTSDNGPWLNLNNINSTQRAVGSAYPLKDGKFRTWEGGVRVPFLVRWPSVIPAGSRIDQVGAVIDVMPTLAKIGGAVIPSDRTVDGLDLLPVWTGNATYPDRSFFVNESGSNNTLIKGNWKIRNNELYDLSADIQEQTNVSGVPANSATLAAMQSERSALITSFNNDNEPRGEFTNFEILLSTNDIDVPEGGTGEAQIRLSAAPGATVTVTVSHFSGDSDLSVSGGSSLVFSNSNWSDWQTVTFAAANDADATSDGATFRAELSTDNNVRELFVFEDDDEAPADVASSLVWPKTLPVVTADSTTKIVGQGRSSLDGQIDQAGSVYAWAKVSGPGAVTFSSPNDKVTGVSFSTDGVYVVRFYADHPSAGSGDSIDFTVYVNVAPENDSTAKFSPQLIYEAESDGDGDATWENTLSPGSMDISLSSGVTRSVAIPGTPVTLVDFGMDGDINGGSAGAEASGISGNGGGVSWALGTPTTLDSNLSIVSGVQSIGIQNGSGISVPAGSGQQTNDYSYIGHDSTTLAGAISGNDYIFVRLTIASGYELYVDGYQFDLWRNGGQAVENYAVFHGASGFSAASGSEDAAANVPGAGTGSLAFLGASGLGAVYTGTVEFRIYGWQGSGQTELGNTHFDAFSLTGIVSETAASGSDSFFSASYNFPGGQTMEGGVAESLVSYSSGNASFEIWFKPSSLPIATPQVLWEAGGDIGVALVLSGISLSFVVDDGDSNVVNGATIDGTLAPDPGQDGYVHAVGVIDLDAGQTKLYLDGVLVDTGLIPNVNTWTGSSGVGVGKIDSAVAGSNGATSFELLGGNDQLSLPIEAFGGEIALIRFYDYALIAGQVSDLFADPAASELLNRSPQISAGPDQAVDFTAPLVLVGSASDDRLGSGELNINWRQVSGADPESAFPGSLTLADYSALSTSGTTNAAGSYTLYLEVDDAEVKVYDNIDIEFSPLTYAQWASTISFPVGESAPTDDPDLDKMANLEEWARGTEPLDFDAAPNSGFSLEKVGAINQYTYTFDVPRDRAPLIALQWSVNLSQWYTVTDVDPRFDVMSGSTVRWSADVAVDISLRSKFFLRGVITAE